MPKKNWVSVLRIKKAQTVVISLFLCCYFALNSRGLNVHFQMMQLVCGNLEACFFPAKGQNLKSRVVVGGNGNAVNIECLRTCIIKFLFKLNAG